MRRITAFFALLVSMLFAVGLISQPILEKTNVSNEFTEGSVIQYSISLPDDSDYGRLDEVDVKGEIMERLDTASIRGAQVDVIWPESNLTDRANTAIVNVSFPSQSQSELGAVRRVLEGNGDLTITTENTAEDEIMTGTEFFAEHPAEVQYDDNNEPYVVLRLKDGDVWQTMVDRAKDDSDSSSDSSDDSSDSSSSTYLYIWRNFDIDAGDSYDKAFSDDSSVFDQLVKDKVLFKIDTSSAYDSEKQWIKISSDTSWNVDSSLVPWSVDGDSVAWNITSARAMVDSINATNYDFDISYVFASNSNPTLSSDALIWTVCGFVLAFVVMYALICVRFGLAGVISCLTDAVSVLVCLLLGSLLGFEFSAATFVGLAVTAIIGALINVNWFSRVLGELKKRRDLVKADSEGYHKSYMATADIVIASVLISLFSFLIGRGLVKIVFGLILIGSVTAFVFSNYFTKWLMYWLTTSWPKAKPSLIFGLRAKETEKKEVTVVYDATASQPAASADDKNEKKQSSLNKGQKGVLGGWLGGSLALIAACALSFGLFGGLKGTDGMLNWSSDYRQQFALDVSTTGTSYTNSEGRAVDFTDADSFTNYILNTIIPARLSAYTGPNGEKYEDVDSFLKGTYLDFSQVEFNIISCQNDTTNEDNTFEVIYATYYMPDVSSAAETVRNLAIDTVLIPGLESLSNAAQNPAAGANINKASDFINTKLEEHYAPYVSYGQVQPGEREFANTFLFIGLACIVVFAFVYAAVRFGLAAGLTQFAVSFLSGLFGLIIFSLFRVPFDQFIGFGLLGAAALVGIFTLPFFARNREIIKESKLYRTASLKTRFETSGYVSDYTLNNNILLAVASALFGVFGLSLYSLTSFSAMGIAFLAVGLFGVLVNTTLVPVLFPWLRAKLSYHTITERWQNYLAKRRTRKKKVIVADPNEAHETVIPGLNEYRTW